MALLMERSHLPVTRSELPWAIRVGTIGGIVAGLVFAAFEMVASAAMMGMDAFFMPLRMIGAIALGPSALEPAYSLFSAGLAGVVIHVVLAIIYGVIFAVTTGGLRSGATEIFIGTAFGFALWLVNFYVIAPMACPWFLASSPLIQFIAHTFFFGSVLGWYVSRSRQRANGMLE